MSEFQQCMKYHRYELECYTISTAPTKGGLGEKRRREIQLKNNSSTLFRKRIHLCLIIETYFKNLQLQSFFFFLN